MTLVYDITAKGTLLPHGTEERARTIAERFVSGVGNQYLVALVNETPRGQGPATGRKRLYQSYDVDERSDTTSVSYRIQNRAPWLRYVLKGRPAMVAAPGKVFRFQIGATVFYRKRVKAAKANPYDRRVAARMRGEIARARASARAEIVRLIGGR